MQTWGWSRWTEHKSSKKVTIRLQMHLHLLPPLSLHPPHRLPSKVAKLKANSEAHSTIVQQLSDPASTMPHPPDQNRPSPLHGGVLPEK